VIKISLHHTINQKKKSIFFRLWNYKLYFFVSYCHENTCCEKYNYYFQVLLVNVFGCHSPPSYLYVCILHLHMTHYCMYTLYSLMLTSIKVCTHDFMEMQQGFNHQIISRLYGHKTKNLTLLCLTWNCLTSSNFNIFFHQILFKCHKLKHDLEVY
jgi:hypothetical protein